MCARGGGNQEQEPPDPRECGGL